MTTNLPWIEKYRPKDLDDLISHDEIINTIKKLLSGGRLPHLMFYGPPGTGKTSTILAIAKQMYEPMEFKAFVLELNSSDDRGMAVVRNEIYSFASSASSVAFGKKFKLIILDEADAMTKDAQNALRRIVEKFTEKCRFCFICNYQNKIIPALQSRCTRFRFSTLDLQQIKPRLQIIIDKENLSVISNGMDALLQLSNGDMRQAINILQSSAMAYDEINEDNVYACVAQPHPKDIKMLLNCLLNDDLNTCISKLAEFRLVKTIALQDIVTSLHQLLLTVELPDEVQVQLFIKLSEIEQRLAIGCTDRLQASSLAAAFFQVRDTIAQHAK